jgi:hypothetical protein
MAASTQLPSRKSTGSRSLGPTGRRRSPRNRAPTATSAAARADATMNASPACTAGIDQV